MQVLRKMLCLVLCCILLMSGCAERRGELVVENARYTIIRRPNGECYLDIPNDTGKQPGCFGDPNAYFLDMKAFKACIIEGTYPKDEFYVCMATGRRNDLGKLIIVDPERLYDVVLPEEMEVYKIGFNIGVDYTFYILGYCGEDVIKMGMHVCLEANCDCINDRHYEDKPSYIYSVDEVLSKTQTPDGSRTEYVFKANGKHFKEIQHIYTDGEDMITFVEEYELDSQLAPVSQIPDSWDFYGLSQGVYFSGYIEDYNSQLDLEQLRYLGLKPYVDSEAA